MLSLRTLFFFLISISTCLADQDSGITIHSVDAPSAASNEASIVVEYTYDGSHGNAVPAGAYAVGGADFDVRSIAFLPAQLLKGDHLKVTLMLSRPPIESGFKTDGIEVFAYEGGRFTFARRIVKHPIEWAAVQSLSHYGNYTLEGFSSAYDVGDYVEAERIFDIWSSIEAVDKNGDQKLVHYLKSMKLRFKHDREGSIAKIRAWRAARPNSIAAAFTEAWFWIAYAEHLHGWKAPDADTLTVIHQYQANAAKILDKTKRLTGKYPLWQLFQLKMVTNGERGEKAVMSAFESAISAQPKFPPLYIEAVQYLAKSEVQGRWHEINEIADRLDKAVSANNPGAYADLMDHAADSASNTILDPFTTGFVSWARTRNSWKALIERYPSAYNLNRYASRACQARDKDAFQTALGKIGRRVIPSAWPSNLSPDLCRHRFLQES